MPLFRRPGNPEGGGDPDAGYVLTSLTASLPNGRQVAAGPGITIQDNGPGADLVIAGSLTSSFIVPIDQDQVLFSATPARFVQSTPITTRNGWLVNSSGMMLVSASL